MRYELVLVAKLDAAAYPLGLSHRHEHLFAIDFVIIH